MEASDRSIRDRLARHWPVFGLEVCTPRLSLQMPTDPELLELLALVDDGVHDPSWMPFQIPWTDAPQPQRARESLAHYWGIRANWTPSSWTWNAAVRVNGAIVGIQAVSADRFSELHEVESGSWLGLRHQGQGIGKEMRAAMLHLAFEGLGAERAYSGYVEGNEASKRVSAALGYVSNGYDHRVIRGRSLREHRVVLERDRWAPNRRADIEIIGLDGCRELFGA
jgi:RimJ/RimL family protein N-acetyltransferase